MKVFLHTRLNGANWVNEVCNFGRVPIVGEFVAISSQSAWFQVKMVVHTPFRDAEFVAEVYATEIDHHEAHKKSIQQN